MPLKPAKPSPNKDKQAYYLLNKEKIKTYNLLRYAAKTPAERWEARTKSMAKGVKGTGREKENWDFTLTERTPQWNNPEEIFRIYVAATVMSELTGEKYVVDHLVPLKSTSVCGLHCHQNLRVVPADQNRSKSNLFWPQMWCIEWENWLQFLESVSHKQQDPFKGTEI